MTQTMDATQEKSLECLRENLASRGVEWDWVVRELNAQEVETPSWGYADSGTRFGVFKQAGVPRNVFEKFEDAAHIQSLMGICPSVAIHIPWDFLEDWTELKDFAADRGVRIGAVNPNVFQEEIYKLGSFGNENAGIREKALERHYECIEVMRKTGSKSLSCWYADGTNYPGQASFIERKHYFEECLKKVYDRLAEDEKIFIEYKLFEPAFYHTDIADWGMATGFCQKLGNRAKVLVDLGHHAQGVNIEHLVAWMLDEGTLGGFHFNNRKYADDDLTVSSINPYEVFLIYNELVDGKNRLGDRFQVDYLIDQSHNIKPKIEAMIQTLWNLQTAFAKALTVDRSRLAQARKQQDIVEAERCLVEAFQTDVEPLLRYVRRENGRPEDPLEAHRRSGYLEKVCQKRAGR
jgi:L-rhamnose isomerase/sugar isomerase